MTAIVKIQKIYVKTTKQNLRSRYKKPYKCLSQHIYFLTKEILFVSPFPTLTLHIKTKDLYKTSRYREDWNRGFPESPITGSSPF